VTTASREEGGPGPAAAAVAAMGCRWRTAEFLSAMAVRRSRELSCVACVVVREEEDSGSRGSRGEK
jgi:hypothetical protein